MGFIERAAGIANFSQAVFSFWFRIPGATYDAVLGIPDEPGGANSGVGDHWSNNVYAPPLYKILPLITFGSQEVTTENSSAGTGVPVSPSFIGIDFSGDDPVLVVNLQMSNFTSGDVTPVTIERPDCFFMGGHGSVQQTSVLPDEWNHALISFDVSGGCSNMRVLDGGGPATKDSLTSGASFTWALNDEDKVGESMAPSGDWAAYGTSDASEIITQGVIIHIVGAEGSEAAWSPVPIAASGNPVGVPAGIDYVGSVYNIQMAEMQVFLDVTTDARVELNRRAFITSLGRPASPSLAASLLGKEPEIYFRTHADFIEGNNRGTAGNFTPTGTIIPYSPGP